MFSTDGTLISASAAPHCGNCTGHLGTKDKKKNENKKEEEEAEKY